MSHYFENDESLKSEIRELSYKYDSSFFTFYSNSGVFSKKGIDTGSKILLETYLSICKEANSVLDMGCGYGLLGIVINKINNSHVDMCDINARCVHLTKRNIKKNKCENINVFESDAYSNVNKKYDVIITNPPIRVGKVKLLEILNKTGEYLNENGIVYYVIRKNQGAESIKKILESDYNIELLNRKYGYFVFKMIKK